MPKRDPTVLFTSPAFYQDYSPVGMDVDEQSWARHIMFKLRQGYSACTHLEYEMVNAFTPDPQVASEVLERLMAASSLMARRIRMGRLVVAAMGEQRVTEEWGRGLDGTLGVDPREGLSPPYSPPREGEGDSACALSVIASSLLSAADAKAEEAGKCAAEAEALAASVDEAADLAAADLMEAEAMSCKAELAAADAMEAAALSKRGASDGGDAAAGGAAKKSRPSSPDGDAVAVMVVDSADPPAAPSPTPADPPAAPSSPDGDAVVVDADAATAAEEDVFAARWRRCEERNAAAGLATTRGERHMMKQYELSVKVYMASEWRGGEAAGFTRGAAFERFDRAMVAAVAMDREDGVEPHWVEHWRAGRAGRVRGGSYNGAAPAVVAVDSAAPTATPAVVVDSAVPSPTPADPPAAPSPVAAMRNVEEEVFTLTYRQYREVRDVLPDQRKMWEEGKYKPRKMVDVPFLEENFDAAEALVDQVDRLRTEIHLGREHGVSDLAVYGILKATPEFDGAVWMAKVFNPVLGVYEAHYFFKKQGLSNFGGFGGVPMSLRPHKSGWKDHAFMMPTLEHALHFPKAGTVKTRQGRKAMGEVLLAVEPVGALKATGRGKLDGLGDAWNLNSAEVMRRLVLELLSRSEPYFNAIGKVVRFSEDVLRVPAGRLFLHEATDHPIYAVNVNDGENPLLRPDIFKADGTHNWKGGDVLGLALTEAARVVARYGRSYDRMVREDGFDPMPIVFKVLPEVLDADDDEEESTSEVRSFLSCAMIWC